jgi:DNA helicase-2/ATP-dependent DNA helicase PcrA
VWDAGGGRAAATAGVSFALGDDVVHAMYGDGVVTGFESKDVIRVRFAADGSEKSLMVDYAPLKKRA